MPYQFEIFGVQINKFYSGFSMQSQLDTSRYARSILSNSHRRDVLWNVSEPGDPYDIKKSMIAKLPGDRKVFMGDHLQLVCLFQAAQIQRLCEFLDDYRLKFREIERNNLDRHSYEIQIKELTERATGEDSLRNENSKLKEFSKRLQGEIEFLQGSSRQSSYQDEANKANYEKTLERLTVLTGENQQLRRQLEDYRYQLQTFSAKFQALQRAKNREIEQLKLNFAQSSRESYETALSSFRLQSEAELKRLQFELKRMRELNEAKNVEISELQNRVRGLSEELQRVGERENRVYTLEVQIREYENKFVIFGTEIERLNIALRDYTNKFEECERRRRQLDANRDRLEHLNQELEGRLRAKDLQIVHYNDIISKFQSQTRKVGQSQQVISQYESKLTIISRQNQNLSSKLKYELQASKRLREQVERLNFQSSKYRLLEKDSQSLKESIAQNSALKKKLVQLENRSVLLSQELQRLQYTIKVREGELEKYRSVGQENQTLKSRISQLEYSYNSRSEIIKSEYEQKLESLSRTQGTEIQSRIQSYQNELERLRAALKARSEECQLQRSKAYELQVALKRLQLDTSAKVKNYELAIGNFKRQNEEYYNRLKTAAENQRRVFELQNKLTQYEREIERVTINIKAREEEVIALRNKLREAEGLTQRYELDVGKSKSGYEQSINALRTDNQALNRKLVELVNESNEKLRLAGQEIDRLGNLLRAKTEQRNQFQVRLKQVSQELESLKQLLQKAGAENEELKRRVVEYEAKINNLFNDSNSSIRTLSQENQQLKKQLSQFKNQTNLYEFQVNKKITIFEQNSSNLVRENDDLKRRINQYQSRLALASQEIERLGVQLRTRTDEFNALKIESQKFKVAFKQYENDVNNHMELEVKRRFKELELKIQELTHQNEELKRRANENVLKFNAQFEKIGATLRQTAQENQNLKNELKKQINDRKEETLRYETAIKQLSADNEAIRRQFKEYEFSVSQRFQGDLQPKLIAFQQTIAKLTKENEDLKRKLQQANNEFVRRINESQTKYATLGQQYQKLRNNANILAQQNDALKKKSESYEVSITNYEGEVKRRFAAFQQTVSGLNKENEQLRRRLQELSEMNRKIAEYQARISKFSQELERLTNALNSTGQENDQLRRQLSEKNAFSNNYELEVSRKVTTYESNLTFLQKDNEQLKKRLNDSDQRLKNLSTQFQKLGQAYKLKLEEFSRLQISIKNYESEVRKTITNNDQNFNNLLRENEDLKRRITEFQNRIALLSQQLERLGLNLKTKQEQNLKVEALSRNQTNQLQSWRRKHNELQAKYTSTYEFQVKKKYNSYEQTISELNRRNTETQVKLNGSIQEIQRLNNILRLKVDQSSQQALQIKTIVTEYEQFKRKVRQNEGNLSQNSNNLKRENDQLRRRLQESETFVNNFKLESDRRNAQTEARFKNVSLEIQRLNSLLKGRNEELDLLRKQFKQYELAVGQKFDGQVKVKFAQYENHIAGLTKQNQELRRRLQEAGDFNRKFVEYQNKIVLIYQQNERLNGVINSKAQQYKKLSAQTEQLRRKLNESIEVNRRVPEYQQRIALIIQQNEKLQYALRGKTDELGNLDIKYKQLQQENETLKKNITNLEYSWSSKYETQINRKTQALEQTQSSLSREKEDLLRRLKEYQAKIALYGQQIERLTLFLKTKTQQNAKLSAELQSLNKKAQLKLQSTESEYVTLQNNYNIAIKEYETAKKHLQEYQQSIRKLYTEFERLQGIINELKKENQTLHNMNHNLSGEINRLTLQNKDLEEQASEVRLRLSDESALQKRINEHLALMVVLFAEIETLRNRVKDKEKEVAEVRRSSLAPNIL